MSKKTLKKGTEISVEVFYQGAPEGIIFKPRSIYANYSSCLWLLCEDIPGDKFTSKLILHTPTNWVSLSNGRQLSNQNGIHTWFSGQEYPCTCMGLLWENLK